MLNWISKEFLVATCGALAIAVISLWPSPPYQTSQGPQIEAKQQPDGGHESQEDGKESKAPIASRGSDNASHGSEEASEYWTVPLLNRRLKITDTLLVLFTFTLFLATRDLVKEAKESSQRDLRAYVGMDKLGFEIPNENNPNFVFDPDTPGVIQEDFITVKVRNYGSTPASDVCVFVYPAVVGPHQRLEDTFLPAHDRDLAPTGAVRVTLARFMLHPNQIEITKTFFHPHAVREARARRATLYLCGRIYYRDIYNRPWRTRFCYGWEPSTTFHGERFVAYEQYNGEDQIELG
jgi:hypothetical protein